MSSTLPERVDPWYLCGNNRSFEGRISLDAFTRLRPLLASTDGEAAFTLRFAKDSENRPVVKGTVDAQLWLCCQRCLQTFPLAISESLCLGLVVGSDEAASLPSALDPLRVVDGKLDLADIIEDELILAIPIIPRHAEAECPIDLTGLELPEEVEPTRENPFSVLENLKHRKSDS